MLVRTARGCFDHLLRRGAREVGGPRGLARLRIRRPFLARSWESLRALAHMSANPAHHRWERWAPCRGLRHAGSPDNHGSIATYATNEPLAQCTQPYYCSAGAGRVDWAMYRSSAPGRSVGAASERASAGSQAGRKKPVGGSVRSAMRSTRPGRCIGDAAVTQLYV